MITKNRRELMTGLLIAAAMISVGLIGLITSTHDAFADTIVCGGLFTCSAIGGNGGHGGNTGDAIGGDIGPGGSCFAIHHSSIGDECGGSTGSSEPRSGSGDHSMNGGRGGEATVHIGS